MNLITRAEWGANPPTGRSFISPSNTAGHWNGGSIWIARWGAILDHSVCYSLVRGIQSFHMGPSRHWSDIAYGALACPHGYVFEGRGVGVRTAANGTNHANTVASAVCYLGGEGDPFTPEGLQAMLDAWKWLSEGERSGHRDWFNTACPGDEIYNAFVYGAAPVPAPVPAPALPPPPPALLPPAPVPGGSDVQTPYLRLGSTGPQVVAMQAMLNFKESDRASLAVDGDFGPVTDAKVRSFQSYYQLGSDGIVGPITWQALVDV